MNNSVFDYVDYLKCIYPRRVTERELNLAVYDVDISRQTSKKFKEMLRRGLDKELFLRVEVRNKRHKYEYMALP